MRAPLRHKDETKQEVTLTREEEKALAKLEKLAATWPKSLSLFSWSGSLIVLKSARGATVVERIVGRISGIPNAGGDPNGNEVWDD